MNWYGDEGRMNCGVHARTEVGEDSEVSKRYII